MVRRAGCSRSSRESKPASQIPRPTTRGALTPSCDDDFSQLPTRGGQPLIFMVGCGHLEDGRFVFRCFTADALTEAAEAEVVERWFGHMEEVKRRLRFVATTRPRPGTPTGRGRTRGSSTS